MKKREYILSAWLILCGLVFAYSKGKQTADRWYAKQYNLIHTQIIGYDKRNDCIVYVVSDKTPGAVGPIVIPNCQGINNGKREE